MGVEMRQRRPHQIPDDQGERSGVAKLHVFGSLHEISADIDLYRAKTQDELDANPFRAGRPVTLGEPVPYPQGRLRSITFSSALSSLAWVSQASA
jgi:hypothetical protein